MDSYNECLSSLGFKESLFLWKDASLVMTNSGGLQEETTGFASQALAFFLIV